MKFSRAPVAAADSRPSRRREGEAARRARSPRPEDSLECNARRAPARLSWSMREVGPLITRAGQRQGRVSLRECPCATDPVPSGPCRAGRAGAGAGPSAGVSRSARRRRCPWLGVGQWGRRCSRAGPGPPSPSRCQSAGATPAHAASRRWRTGARACAPVARAHAHAQTEGGEAQGEGAAGQQREAGRRTPANERGFKAARLCSA